MKNYHIFIGYDDREHDPYLVAKHSLELHNINKNIVVHPLKHQSLRDRKLFSRPWLINADGQYFDVSDCKPFSTQFSHSRFLVPSLWRALEDENKSPLTMFVDCDFVWNANIQEMFEEIETTKTKNDIGVFCTKHDYNPENTIKMDNKEQTSYNKKLWSAMMVFNMDSGFNTVLSPAVVNTQSGRWLHQLSWLRDDQIGDIAEEWHVIPNHTPIDVPRKAVHYTEGGPWFDNYKDCAEGTLWTSYYKSMLNQSKRGK